MHRLSVVASLVVALCACEFNILPEPGGKTGSDDPESTFTSPWESRSAAAAATTTGGTGTTPTGTVACKGTYGQPGQQHKFMGALPPGVAGVCTIQGVITITGAVTDAQLEGIASVQTVLGNIYVSGASQIKHTAWLRGLSGVQGGIQFINNATLQQIALPKLANVGDQILVASNNALTKVAGSNALAGSNLRLTVQNCGNLTTIDGFANVQSFSALMLSQLPALTSVGAFTFAKTAGEQVLIEGTGLQTIVFLPALSYAQSLSLNGNNKLASFNFPALKQLGSLNLTNNLEVTQLSGFPALGQVQNISVCSNPKLPADVKQAFLDKYKAANAQQCN